MPAQASSSPLVDYRSALHLEEDTGQELLHFSEQWVDPIERTTYDTACSWTLYTNMNQVGALSSPEAASSLSFSYLPGTQAELTSNSPYHSNDSPRSTADKQKLGNALPFPDLRNQHRSHISEASFFVPDLAHFRALICPYNLFANLEHQLLELWQKDVISTQHLFAQFANRTYQIFPSNPSKTTLSTKITGTKLSKLAKPIWVLAASHTSV